MNRVTKSGVADYINLITLHDKIAPSRHIGEVLRDVIVLVIFLDLTQITRPSSHDDDNVAQYIALHEITFKCLCNDLLVCHAWHTAKSYL